MLRNECENCKLRFETFEDMQRHQKKFCVDSDYGNVVRLERKLQDLNNKDSETALAQAVPTLVDIKSYLRGEGEVPNNKPSDQRKLEDFKSYNNVNSRQQPQLGGASSFQTKQGDMFDQLNQMKQNKQQARVRNDNEESEMLEMIRELEQRKEKELRAQMDKEEILRNIKDLDRGQLTALEREKKKELERLATDRENLKQREMHMMDEIKKMELNLAEQERNFKLLRDSQTTATTKPQMYGSKEQEWGVENEIRRKELEMAKERGTKVVEFRAQREKLERDRQRIMEDLDKIKTGQPLPRRNDAARLAAGSQLGFNNGPLGSFNNQYIEPSLKDKLVNDQAKINKLRNQQKQTMNEVYPDMDDIDVLQREMEGRNFQNDTQQYVNTMDGRQHTPNRNAAYLTTIRQKLENQAAAPSRTIKYNHQLPRPVSNYGGNDYMNTEVTEGFDDGYEQPPRNPKGQMIGNLQSLKDDYLLQGGEDPEFVQKVSELESFLKYRKPLNNAANQLPQRQAASLPSQAPRQYQASPQQQPPLPSYQPPIFPAPPQFNMHPDQQPNPGFSQGVQSYPNGFQSQAPPQQAPVKTPAAPVHDPMLEQLNLLMQQQQQETLKLKQALETIGSHDSGKIDHIIEKTTKELKDLKAKLSQGALNSLPKDMDAEDVFDEDFIFRQNEFRSEDLDTEERALMNLAAQEYDGLRILSRLPKNSEVYQYKMQQYREMSTMRAEMEKVLQEQRLEKIRRDFEKQKYEEERKFKHETWLEEQKRKILEAKIRGASEFDPNQMSQQQQQTYPLEEQQQQFSRTQQKPDTFNNQQPSPPMEDGFILGLDNLFNIPREYRQIRLVYSVCLDKRMVIQPRMIDLKSCEADIENPNFNKVLFNIQHILKGVTAHQNANLIIELQTPDPNKPEGFSSLGWTVLNVFDIGLNLNKGKWKLPVYRTPTILDLDLKDVAKLTPMFKLLMCIRICQSNDAIFNQRSTVNTKPVQYEMPQSHDVYRPEQPDSQNKPQAKVTSPRATIQANSGLSIFVNFIRGLKPFSRVKVQATLYEGIAIVKQESNLLDCNWASFPQDNNQQLFAPRGSKIEVGPNNQVMIQKPMGPPANTASDEIVLPINQEVTWLRDLNRLLRDHQLKDNINLLLQVFLLPPPSLPGGPVPPSSNYETLGYTVFQVNNQDGSIKNGSFELGLYRLPINLLKQEPSNAIPAMIRFSLGPPRTSGGPKPNQGPQSQQKQLPGSQNNNQGASQNGQLRPPAPTDQYRPATNTFVPNFDKQWTKSDEFGPGDGIDIYIDWARYLPDNTMFSKVFARVIDASGQYPIPGSRGFASVDFSTQRNAFFGFKYEVRADKMNPTLLLVVSFETIDRSSGKPCYSGHSYFPLFMDKTTERPILDANSQNFTLHKGHYQMPVYCQMPNLQPPGPITYERFIQLERIPTSSMLLRIINAPRGPDGKLLNLENTAPEKYEELGVLMHAPEYQDGIYNTQYYFNTALEIKLFSIRKARKEVPLSAVANQMMIINKQSPDLPIDKKLDIINQMITLPQNTSQMIDMTYFAPYNQELGFRFGVECLYNNTQTSSFFMIIASLCPSASFYDTARVDPPEDVVTFTGIDWQSSVQQIKFNDGQYAIQDIPADQGMSIIFDVKKIASGGKQYDHFGFAVYPLFSQLVNEERMVENFVNSGIYQLPLYQGQVPTDLLTQLRTTRDVQASLNAASAKFKLLDTSIIIKCVDNQRERHFDKGFEFNPPSTKFVTQDKLAKISFKPFTRQQLDGHKKMASNIPSGQMASGYQTLLADIFNKQFKL